MSEISHSKKFVFIANPKTASTSVAAVLRQAFPGELVKDPPVGAMGLHSNYLGLRTYLQREGYNIDEYFVFGFLRHPLTRISSAHFHQKNADTYPHTGYINPIKDKDIEFYIKWLGAQKNPSSKRLAIGDESNVLLFRKLNYMFYDESGKLPSNVFIYKTEEIEARIPEILKTIDPIHSPFYNKKIPVKNRKHRGRAHTSLSPESLALLKNYAPLDFEYYKEINMGWLPSCDQFAFGDHAPYVSSV